MTLALRSIAAIQSLAVVGVAMLGCTTGQIGGDGLGGGGDRVDLDGPADGNDRADDGSDTSDPADPDGDDGQDRDPADPGDDGAGDAGSLCEACINQSCAAEYQACGAVAECVALDQCAGACADEACYTQCEQSHPTGVEPLFAFYDCLDANCAQPCGGGADDGAEDPGDGAVGADPCGECVDATCGAAWQACEADADCAALMACYEACGESESCWYDCEDQHPTGTEVYFSFLDCVYGACGAQCGG